MVFVRRRRHWRFGTTADIGIAASAPNAEALFEEVAKALFGLMTYLNTVRLTDTRTVSVSSTSPEGLLVAFLSELLYLDDAEGFVFRDFKVRMSGSPPTSLNATCVGERWDNRRHQRRIEVKAITMHRATLDLDKFRAKVIVDI